MQNTIGLIAGIMSFAAYGLYIVTTIFPGKFFGQATRPNRATWWILTLVGALVAESYWSSGAEATIWVALSYVAGPFLIGLTSLNPKWGVGGWEGNDKWCLLGAVACLSFRVNFMHLPEIALILSLAVDLLGLLPTIEKSYKTAQSEDRIAWGIETGACFINLFAIHSLSWEIWVQPVYLFMINSIVVLLLFRNNWCHKILNHKTCLKPS